MKGKVCVVTGATSGIGQVTAAELTRRGAHVVIVGRSAEKCAATAQQIRSQASGASVDAFVADLSSLDEVRRLAGQIAAAYPRIDVLVNNAGAMYLKRSESVDGIEKTLALNHFSYFVLTNLLLPVLIKSAPSRIVNVASEAHRGVSIDFDDIQFHNRYRAWNAYRQSKLANVLFTFELARRIAGTGVTANALHPGFVNTNFFESFKDAPRWWLFRRLADWIALSPEQGSRTSIHLASSPEVAGVSGRYFAKQKPANSSRQSRDQAAAERLWQLSAQMTGAGGA
jgi:NAD(P)-dependent dehydrogenase (short-subunit alcohol dehydrogenase family)